MQKIEVTWGKATRVWWSFFWRGTILGMIAGAALGAIGGFVVGVMGKPELGPIVGGVLGWLASIPISIWILKNLLNKKYKTFSVALIGEDALPLSGHPAEYDPARSGESGTA